MAQEQERARTAYSRPQGPARLGLVVIALFAGTMTAWSALAPLSDAAVAQGSLQVEGRRQSVEHPYGGVIEDLRVSEGDHVEKGDILITLSDTERRSNRDVLLVEKTGLLATKARLVAEREGWDAPRFPDNLDRLDEAAAREAVASETAILETRNRQHEAAVNVVSSQIAQFRETIAGAKVEAAGLERQAGLIDEELEAARSLLEEGYTPRPRVLGLEREASQLRSALAAKTAEIASARQSIAEAESEMARLEHTRLTTVTEELRGVQTKLAEIEPKLEAAEDALRRTEITAPATGQVVALSVFTEGGVVQPGAKLMEIVPSGNPFFVEARLPLTELNGIEPGQEADIQLLSVPRSDRPHMSGTVETISADRLEDERTGEGYYSLQVRLDPDDLDDADIELQAGMPVQVVMPTEARTLIGYLTSPLLDEVSTAFRES